MLKALIVDDESHCREALKILIIKYCSAHIKIVGMAETVDAAYGFIKYQEPDVIFLDVSMPPTDGFELLRRVNEPRIKIIFTTAYSEYAIKAIKAKALDYLLKPIDPDELIEAVAKLGANDILASKGNSKHISKVHILTNKSSQFIDQGNIIWIESDLKKAKFVLKGNQLLSSNISIGEYETILNDLGFIRVHREYIVNLQEIKEYLPDKNGGWIVMSDGKVIPVAFRRKKEFINLLGV